MTVSQAVALSLRERAEKYAEGVATVTGERMLPYLRSLPDEEMLAAADRIEKLDRVARRAFRLDDNQQEQPMVNVNILSMSLEEIMAGAGKNPEIDVTPRG